MKKTIFLILHFISVFMYQTSFVAAQECIGGQIHTQEEYLYGRFEVGMQSVAGGGIVTSFFLYNLSEVCEGPVELNEIDIEMTGNNELLQFTTHYPSLTSHSDAIDPGFNPHEDVHDYAIEWEPGIVRWFADGELVNVQDEDYVADLIYPLEIMMNFWASESTGWTGVWDPSIMPVEAQYDYVKCYAYTPGAGSYGTDNNFSMLWEDNFSVLDTSIWTITDNAGFGGNYCQFRSSSVEFRDGSLFLQMEEEEPDPELIPVTFKVETTYEDLNPSDIVYLNSSFNGWCGTCEPMTKVGDIWSVTVDLTPGTYEYLFTLNGWDEIGGTPLGSDCDYIPCDEYNNYGFVLYSGTPYVVLEPPCWGSCEACALPTTISNQFENSPPRLLRICDLLGRETNFQPGQLLLYYYSDGRVEKKVVWR